MEFIYNTIQLIIILLAPWLATYLARESKFFGLLGAVGLCYIGGILMGQLPAYMLNEKISKTFTELSIIVAIPLILLSNNPKEWIKSTKTALISFSLAIVSVVMVSITVSFFYKGKIESLWMLTGMMVGVYTGGTPNLTSIGKAFGVGEHLFLLVNGADIILGGLYLLLLLSVMKRFLLLFLPDFDAKTLSGTSASDLNDDKAGKFWKNVRLFPLVAAFLLVLGFIGSGLGISHLITQTENAPIILLSVTTMGILFSLIPKVRNIKGTFESGNYLVLLFCFALGSQINLEKFADAGSAIFVYVAIVMTISIILHYVFCYFFKIDTDTAIITSTAAIFGAPMIIPVANSLKNNHIIMAGISVSLAGYALANYLGLAVGFLVKP